LGGHFVRLGGHFVLTLDLSYLQYAYYSGVVLSYMLCLFCTRKKSKWAISYCIMYMVIYNTILYRFYKTISCSLTAHFSNEWKFLKSEFDYFFPTPLLPKMLNKSIIWARMFFCDIWGDILSHLGYHFVTFVNCKNSSFFMFILL